MTIKNQQPQASIPINKIKKFEDFFRLFQEKPSEFKYRDKISKIYAEGENALVFLFEDLNAFEPDLAEMLKNDPEDVIPDAVEAFKNLLKFLSPGGKLKEGEEYFVRVSTENDSNFIPLRKLRSKHIDKLIFTRGILVRASAVRPKLEKAIFKCVRCDSEFPQIQLSNTLIWPSHCLNPKCKANTQKDFIFVSKKSDFIDWQKITIQETPEELPPGRIPRSVDGIIIKNLVDMVRPGDRIKMMGVYKSLPQKNAKGRGSLIFTTFIDINFIESSGQDEKDFYPTEEELKEIKELAAEPFIQRKIARSIAPTIYGREELKLATALCLFGGDRKKKIDGTYRRGDIHILFVGDPGTGKSEILKSAVSISPRALYTSGKGSTAVGLTAAVVKDSDTGTMSLEAGAIVLADGGIAAIDEFDKMEAQDISAIHEAMAQQSFHPSFEVILSDGRKHQIGHFVDKLFETLVHKKIQGINCEILPIADLNIGIYSSNFKDIYKTIINRVSRHEAPDHFIKIQYSNGREITVTPEHPIFYFNNGKIEELPAENVEIGSFIPAIKNIEFHGDTLLKLNFEYGKKVIKLPDRMTVQLAKFLGYFVSEGYSYQGVKGAYEIGLSNTNLETISRMKIAIFESFAIEPFDNTLKNRTLRIVSKSLFNYMMINFPELMKKSIEKRIPQKIFVSSKDARISFLNAAFEGDGSAGSQTIAYSTSSKGLAEDYQDLLLSIGIHTRINKSYYQTPKGKVIRQRYKVFIRGDSLKDFVEQIIPNLKSCRKISKIFKNNKNKNRKHDILPTDVGRIIINCLKKLGIPYDGYFDQHLKRKYGITRETVNKYLNIITFRIKTIKKEILINNNLRHLREITGYSQEKIANLINGERSMIDYIERGGYVLMKRIDILSQIKQTILREIENVQKMVCYIELLLKFRWLRIKNKKIIENSGKYQTKWVYDVTVIPTKNFVSHGILLHNTVSIAKAGIIATLRAQTGIIAAGNPYTGRYNKYKTPTENIRQPPTLLSRFDLIFIVLDEPDKAKDAQLAEFILEQAIGDFSQISDNSDLLLIPIKHDLLKKYINYARLKCHPVLTIEAKDKIKEYYLNLRNKYEAEQAIVAILARNLEALIRLSEAYTKMALREKVLLEDVEEIIKLFDRHLRDVGYDESTGKFDIDRIFTGQTRSKINKITKILDRIKKMINENEGKAIEIESVIEILEVEEDLDREFIEETITQAVQEGTLYKPKNKYIQFVDKR